MTDPTRRNRLDEEESPYLRQHADNPVHWQPWDDAALAAARERDVPVFLSIGYSACHWCHVMEEESFEDPEVAAVLNENFVPIKVDREERPDVDDVYMTVCQAVTGSGGWPLSAWLTPDGRPFYVGTYFPKESRHGRPGFVDLLERIAEDWRTNREEIEERADRWTEVVRGELEGVPEEAGEPSPDVLERAAEAAVRTADREHGGFGTGQKFPQTGRLELLLRASDWTGRAPFREVAVEALDAMAGGGLYDHVGGGFHRYCTDRDWTVPHFEKMLYDNAELPRVYLAGYQVTGDERYAEVVRETFEFLDRELSHPEGGFYSTLDARSPPPDGDGAHDEEDDGEAHDEEGAFYVWTPEQVEDAVDDPTDAAIFRDRFGVTEAGNFEGATVLTVSASVADLADEHDLDEAEVRERLDRTTRRAFEARAERSRPRRDEKVLAGWNGLAVSALAEAGIVLDPDYAVRAVEALEFVREELWNADAGRLHRRFKDGDVAVDGYLEDYGFLARGALDCYQATGDVEHFAFAVDLARVVVAEFWDADAGTLYATPASGEQLVARPQELDDQSTPSSVGVAVRVLLALDQFVPDETFGEVAETVLETHAETVADSPARYATLAVATDALVSGPVEFTVSAEDLPADWRERIGGTYLPGRLLARRPPDEAGLADWLDRLGLEDSPPVWAGREARDGRPTLYVCRARTCSPPVHDVEAGLDWAADLAPGDGDGPGPDDRSGLDGG